MMLSNSTWCYMVISCIVRQRIGTHCMWLSLTVRPRWLTVCQPSWPKRVTQDTILKKKSVPINLFLTRTTYPNTIILCQSLKFFPIYVFSNSWNTSRNIKVAKWSASSWQCENICKPHPAKNLVKHLIIIRLICANVYILPHIQNNKGSDVSSSNRLSI